MRHLCAAMTAFVCCSGQAVAAGYAIKEHSADAMAAAYAGAAASGTDASYLAYNPASLADVERSDFSLSAIAILPTSNANYSVALSSAGTPLSGSKTPKEFIADAIVPDIGVRYRLSDRWALGFSLSAPWGLKTQYPDGWAGRYYAERTQLVAIDASPTISYQVSPSVALAASVNVEYVKGTLTAGVDLGTLGALYAIPGSIPGAQDGQATLHAQSWGVGFTVGTIVRLDDGFRVGLSYRSPVHHSLRGPIAYTLDGAGIGATLHAAAGLFTDTTAKAALTMPDVIALGATKELSDRWTALGELDWTNWSHFHELRIVAANPAQPDDVTDAQWSQGWFGSLGVQYRADDRWRLRAGLAYDTSPAPSSTLGPRIPDANRFWVSAGGRYQIDDATDVNLTLGELFNSGETISRSPLETGNALRGTLVGTTNSGVTVVGLELSYRQ